MSKGDHRSNKLRAYAVGLQLLQEEERAQLAREVHDNLAQDLIGISFNLAWITRHLEKGNTIDTIELKKRADNMSTLVERSIKSARSISTQLRPAILDSLGLSAALEWLVDEFCSKSKIACEIETKFDPKEPIDSHLAWSIFKLVTELLKIIEGQSASTYVKTTVESTDAELILQMEEDGLDQSDRKALKSPSSLVLFEIHALVTLLNGKITIDAGRRGGATIRIVVPVAQDGKSKKKR